MTVNFVRCCVLLVLFVRCYCIVELECGEQYKPPNTYIGGGREVDDYEHPWFCDYDVRNLNGTQNHCGGTLISHEYIVTAAHCFDKAGHDVMAMANSVINLKCGAINSRIALTAVRVIKHSEWHYRSHDIAVIQIPKTKYSTTLRPACVISRENLLLDSKLTVVGTGSTYMSWISGLPKYAQTTDIYLKDAVNCQDYSSQISSPNNILCAGNFLKTVQPGDSGGPLLVFYDKRYYLVGTITAGKNNFMATFDQNTYPALFTRVKSLCEFFKNHTNFECYSNLIPLREDGENKHVCGHTTVLSNGTTLHPWYCRIYNAEGIDFCGATLISFSHAITAAHCVKSEEHQLDLRTSYIKCGLRHQQRWLKKAVISPGYTKNSVKNDIAVLEVKEKFRYDGFINSICYLPREYPLKNEMMAIGRSYNDDESRNRKVIGTEFPVHIVSQWECTSNDLRGINNNAICTKAKNRMISEGDSGGPLVMTLTVKNQTMYYVTGVISQGNENSKVVSFAKVQNFQKFIFNLSEIEPSSTSNPLQTSFLLIFVISSMSIVLQKSF